MSGSINLTATDIESSAFSLPQRFRELPAFEQLSWLNDAYRDRPVHPDPPARTQQGFLKTAEGRLSLIPQNIKLRNSNLLEIGCGTGHFAEVVAPKVSTYVGVDIETHSNWQVISSNRGNAQFYEVDLTKSCDLKDESFDVIVSWVVWEHLEHPRTMLQTARRLLRPGGHLIFKANVYTSAIASHLYRDIYFPWPHLLYRDHELIDFVRQKWLSQGTTSAEERCEEQFPTPCLYVNRLTLSHYLEYFREQRWHLLQLSKANRRIDEAFYSAFQADLGRYPRSDLALDFLTAVLRKPKRERAFRSFELLLKASNRLVRPFV